jgi:steroid delta-isomerase-like uncharacterized protein
VSEENKKIARKFMDDAWSRGHVEIVDQLMSPKCRFHDPVFPSLTSGVDAYRKHIVKIREAFPDLKFTIEDVIAENNEVVLHWTVRGTHRGEFLGMPPTQKTASVSGTSINRIEKGQIVEMWSDWNLMSLMEQLGVAPAIPHAAKV